MTRVVRRLGLLLPLVTSFLGLCACTYTSAVSTTNIPAQRSRSVTASSKRYIVLGLVFDNDEVLSLPDKLADKCPGGAVRGITTHNMKTMYFLDLFWAREVVASGFCVKATLADGAPLEEETKSLPTEVSKRDDAGHKVEL